MTCRGFLQFILKLLNLVLIIVGVIMIAYSIWMLKQWHSHSHSHSHSHHNPKPPLGSITLTSTSFESASKGLIHAEIQEKLPKARVKRPILTLVYNYSIEDHPFLPDPWFIYGFLGLGILATLIPFSGYIAAEISNGCCLSCYALFLVIILVIQAAVVATIFFDHHWEEDIPKDPTGELDQLKDFVIQNFDICKWVGLGVVIVEALSLLFAMILQAVVSNAARRGYDSDDDYVAPRYYHRPLLNRQPAQGGNATDPLPQRNNTWSTRFREKYGGSNMGQSRP